MLCFKNDHTALPIKPEQKTFLHAHITEAHTKGQTFTNMFLLTSAFSDDADGQDCLLNKRFQCGFVEEFVYVSKSAYMCTRST